MTTYVCDICGIAAPATGLRPANWISVHDKDICNECVLRIAAQDKKPGGRVRSGGTRKRTPDTHLGNSGHGGACQCPPRE
jgi:hypothetical protein